MAAGGRNRCRGTTLVELMVVILIVAILAAAAVPILRGRIDAAKWVEGKAIMGTIAVTIRAYVVERNKDIPGTPPTGEPVPDVAALGFLPGDLDGTYFAEGDFTWDVTYDRATSALTFLVTAKKPAAGGIGFPYGWELDQSGNWTELTGGP